MHPHSIESLNHLMDSMYHKGHEEEKMAVIIMETSWEKASKSLYYPTFSGVYQSYNYYPTYHHMTRKEGVGFFSTWTWVKLLQMEKNHLRYLPLNILDSTTTVLLNKICSK